MREPAPFRVIAGGRLALGRGAKKPAETNLSAPVLRLAEQLEQVSQVMFEAIENIVGKRLGKPVTEELREERRLCDRLATLYALEPNAARTIGALIESALKRPEDYMPRGERRR